MRNFWVAIIGVLMIASFAGTSFATAPVVQDIPDFRLLTVSDEVVDFDLNDYVTDYDDDPADLLWTIEDAGGIAASLGSHPDTNLLDIGASATVAQGTMILRATDASEYSEDSSVVKYSTLMLVGPGLTQDYNLTPATDTFPRTLVIQADNATSTSDINALITPAQVPGTVELTVSIADLDGNLLAGDNTAAAEYGELSANIGVDGSLTVAAPAGAYPLSGMYQLSGAYRVGVKAKLTGGVGAANWDGMELLVSHGRFPTRSDQNTSERLAKFSGFEGVSGALPAGVNAMRALADADNPRWQVAVADGATAIVVGDGVAPASSWATSGNALEITLPAQGNRLTIQSENFTDIQPGETLTFAMNLSTDVGATDVNVPDIVVFMGSAAIPSNWYGMTLGKGANTDVAVNQVPQNNTWRTIKTTFVADTFGAAVDDNGTPINVYRNGYVAAIAVTSTNPNPCKVWIDNIRIYRDKSDLDKALGTTKVNPVLNVAPRDTYFDGTFGSGATTLSALGWTEVPGRDEGTAVIDSTGLNTPGFDNGTNALDIYMDSALGRTANQLQVNYCSVDLDATAAGGVNSEGDNIIGASLWFKTNAGAPKDAPGFMVGLADLRFMNTPFADVGYAGCPLEGQGWKKVQISSARLDYAGRFNIMLIVRAEDLPIRQGWGSFGTATTKFGAESDAHVYIDNIEVHTYQDEAMYFDRSVFPVAD